MSAGKGDKPRNCFSEQYKSNFDDINWGGKISTPCVRICKLKNDVCTACGRTSDQIKNWLSYSEKQRKEIMGTL
jgi:hypothetical protein